MLWRRILSDSIKAGTMAALAMIPFGLAFRVAGLRVGYYGPKFAQLFVADPGIPFRFAQHIVIGWLSAFPLVAWLYLRQSRALSPVSVGALYGAGYYVVVNSLLLPISFGDPLPWTLGLWTIVPSLVIHLVFGAVIGYMCRSRGA